MGDIEKGVTAGPSTPAEGEELAFLLKVKESLFCATADPDLDMARAFIEALKKQGLQIFAVGVDMASGSDRSVFLSVNFGKSPLLQALDLIGPAQDEEHFQVRLSIALLIVRPIIRSHENKILRVDQQTKQADVREVNADLASALAGTEFTAKVLQPDSAHDLVVDIDPKQFIPGYVPVVSGNHPFKVSAQGIASVDACAVCGDPEFAPIHKESP